MLAACHHPLILIRLFWNLACDCDGEQPWYSPRQTPVTGQGLHSLGKCSLRSQAQSWGFEWDHCKCLVPMEMRVGWCWSLGPRDCRSPTLLREICKTRTRGFQSLNRKTEETFTWVSFSFQVPYEFCHARVTQAAPLIYLISAPCNTSLCVPGLRSFLFSHPVPAHQLSWLPQFCVLCPFFSVRVVLWHCIWQAAPQCYGRSWTLPLGLEKCTAQREGSTQQWLVLHILTDQSRWGSFIGFSWTGGFHTSIIPSQRADFRFKDLAVLKRDFSTYTEFI